MEIPKLRHTQTQITQQVAKFVCAPIRLPPYIELLPKFRQALLKISSNPGLLLVLRFVLYLVFALNPQQDPIILTC